MVASRWPAMFRKAGDSLEVTTMSETAFIIAEIIVGIAVLGVLSAVVTAAMVPWLSRRPGAREVLGERYARGEISRDEYLRMRQDLEIEATAAIAPETLSTGDRDAKAVGGPR